MPMKKKACIVDIKKKFSYIDCIVICINYINIYLFKISIYPVHKVSQYRNTIRWRQISPNIFPISSTERYFLKKKTHHKVVYRRFLVCCRLHDHSKLPLPKIFLSNYKHLWTGTLSRYISIHFKISRHVLCNSMLAIWNIRPSILNNWHHFTMPKKWVILLWARKIFTFQHTKLLM